MKKLSIIIPAYNEAQTIAKVLRAVFAQDLNGWDKEIIVVDDCSTDQTGQAVAAFAEKIVYRKHPVNLGKGAAIRTALEAASGDYAIIQDADLEYDPADFTKLLAALGEIDEKTVVYGSRNLMPERRGYYFFVAGVEVLTRFLNLLFGTNLTDVYTCYKLLPLALFKSIPLNSNGFEFEAEITIRILKAGYRIKEVSIHYYPRTFAQGKKIKIRDGLHGLWTILKYRFH